MFTNHDSLTRTIPVRLGLRILFVGWVASAAGFWGPARAQGQAASDVQGLIGYAVTTVGPQYQDVEQAITRFKNRDVNGARSFLLRAKEKSPELPPADVLLAKLHFAGRQEAAGRKALEQAVLDHADDPEAYLLMGELSLNEGRLAAADLLYSRAASLNKTLTGNDKRKRDYDLRSLNGLSRIAETRNDWEKALTNLRALAKAEPDSAQTWSRLGQAFFRTGNAPNARRAYEKARQLDSAYTHPDIALASLYRSEKKSDEASKSMEQAIQSDANNLSTRLAYARWLMESAKSDEAKPHIAAALKLNANSSSALGLSGVLSRMEGDYNAAERSLVQAHMISPSNTDIINQLALVLAEQDDATKQQRAVEFATVGLRQDPNQGELYATLSWIYYRLGRNSQANQALQEAIKPGRGVTPDGRYLLADVLFDQGQNDAAGKLLEPALAATGLFVHRKQAEKLLSRIKQ